MDCLEGMGLLENNYVNLLLTDIPYGKVSRESNGLRKLDKENADVETFNLDKFLEVSYQKTKGTMIIFCGHEQYGYIYDWFNQKAQLKEGTVRGLCWHKNNPSPANGQYVYLNSFELAVWFRKKGSSFNAFCKHNVFQFPIGKSKIHPTQKNLELFKELISDNSNEGDLILDTCMGSGTTAIAAIDTNRNYIGFELNNTYYEIAKNRINQHIIDNNLQDKYSLIT